MTAEPNDLAAPDPGELADEARQDADWERDVRLALAAQAGRWAA